MSTPQQRVHDATRRLLDLLEHGESLSPEAIDGGPIGRLRDGDMLRLDAAAGTLDVLVDAPEWSAREPARAQLATHGCGRELFATFRERVGAAEAGASVLF